MPRCRDRPVIPTKVIFIWSYVARNLARPVWLASEAQKADVVIGNPPWVSYRYMHRDFKARFRQESRAANLWVGGKVATQQDLSTYFSLRAAGLYLRRGGWLPIPRKFSEWRHPFSTPGGPGQSRLTVGKTAVEP